MTDANDPLAEANARLARLFADLANAPVVALTGVVSAASSSAAQTAGQDFWTFAFTFAAWRIDDGPVQGQPLTVRRRVSKPELPALRNAAHANAIVRIDARLGASAAFDGPQALLASAIRPAQDADLHAAMLRLQQPVVYEDPTLGPFTLDRSVDWYKGAVSWCGETVDLVLDANTPETLRAAAEVARALCADQTTWRRRIRDYAIAELLPLKNEAWLDDDDDRELTAAEFESRMTLEAITVSPDGEFDFWHHDGDLFFGHTIQISGDLKNGPTRADIPG